MQPDILSQLNDIQTPAQVGWWPLAWGWYALAIFMIAAIALLVVFVRRRRQLLKAKKQALKMLATLDDSLTNIQKLRQINTILKRAALSYTDREVVAELHGEHWAAWLNSRNSKGPQFDTQLLSLAYQRDCSHEQVVNLKLQTEHWIKTNLPLKQRKERAGV